MDPKRQGEIALKLLKYLLRKKGVHLSNDALRDIGNTAKAIDVSVNELKQFAKPILQEFMDECFAIK